MAVAIVFNHPLGYDNGNPAPAPLGHMIHSLPLASTIAIIICCKFVESGGTRATSQAIGHASYYHTIARDDHLELVRANEVDLYDHYEQHFKNKIKEFSENVEALQKRMKTSHAS